MGSVASQLTRIHDAEGALTTANLPAGGGGATANTDIFLQGAQSLGRRQTNTTDFGGFVLVDAADNDVSAAGSHVGVWFWVTHFGILDDVRLILATGTGSPTNYDSHAFPLTEYPKLGGWVRGWVHAGRTPEVVGGTGLNEAQLRSYGVQISFTSAPGGNAANLILDAADFVSGTQACLVLTGASSVWQDFATADENSTNQYGVFRSVGGVYNCFARVQLGSSGSSVAFSDSNFTIIFPQQNLVSTDFMGVNVNLQHASTSITWTNGVIKSAGTRKGDLVVTGTTSTAGFNPTGCTFDGMRVVTLTSKCTFSTCTFQNSGQITQGGATLSTCRIAGSTAASALLSDDPSKITNSTFVSAGTGHAVELTTAGTYDFTGNKFSGYGADGTTNASIYNNSGGAITLNILGGGDAPTVRNGAGASTTIVAGSVTATITVTDTTGAPIQSARVLMLAASGGPMPFDVTVTIANSGTTATVTHSSHGLVTGDRVQIKGASHWQNNGVFSITVTGAGTYTYTLPSAPGSNPTGTIKSTFAFISGLTDVNGVISNTRTFSSNQPISGRARKSTSAPYYKTGPFTGIISNTTGFSANVQLVPDQ